MKEDYDKVKKQLQEMPDKMKLQNNSPRLRVVVPYYNGITTSPPEIPQDSPGGVVFFNLQLCYQNQQNVSEGILEDVIWGFRQSGIPADITWEGFKTLKKFGYIFFHDGTGTAIIGDPNEKLWYRWTLKYIDLLRGRHETNESLKIEEHIKPVDTNWEKIKE
jgi:hypothetical protein